MRRRYMMMTTHENEESIPPGFAVLVLQNSGWVGTNNGWPFAGQPALFPEAQAEAICYAWNAFDLNDLPSPDALTPEVREWLNVEPEK